MNFWTPRTLHRLVTGLRSQRNNCSLIQCSSEYTKNFVFGPTKKKLGPVFWVRIKICRLNFLSWTLLRCQKLVGGARYRFKSDSLWPWLSADTKKVFLRPAKKKLGHFFAGLLKKNRGCFFKRPYNCTKWSPSLGSKITVVAYPCGYPTVPKTFLSDRPTKS